MMKSWEELSRRLAFSSVFVLIGTCIGVCTGQSIGPYFRLTVAVTGLIGTVSSALLRKYKPVYEPYVSDAFFSSGYRCRSYGFCYSMC